MDLAYSIFMMIFGLGLIYFGVKMIIQGLKDMGIL